MDNAPIVFIVSRVTNGYVVATKDPRVAITLDRELTEAEFYTHMINVVDWLNSKGYKVLFEVD